MASNLPACSAGMMPSQSCATKFALDLHLVAQRVGDVDVEADELAVGGQIVEGRVGAFGADFQLARVLREGGADGQDKHGGRGGADQSP